MKYIKIFIPILFIFIGSCTNRKDVVACFVVSGNIHYKDEPVIFVDCSQYAEEYNWNFGDGTSSNLKNPSHIYTSTGTYQVTLTVNGKKTTETLTQVVTVVTEVSACFTISDEVYYVNQLVSFVNCSQNADSYDWSFGDGFTSNQKNPSHIYSQKGTYQVIMTAYGYNHETFSDVVTIIERSTDLNILVRFEGTETVVPDCEVTLYGSYEDWNTFNNPIVTDYTNTNGIVVFEGLDPVVYFIDAYLGGDGSYYSNEELGIETDPLAEGEINYYNIYLRQYTIPKRDRTGMPIVKVEKSSKEEHDRIINANTDK